MQMQNPGQQNVGYQNPGYQNAGYQNPGYQNVGYQNPGYPVPGNGGDLLATPSMILGIVGDVAYVIAIFVGMSAQRKILGYAIDSYDESTVMVAGLLAVVGMICALIGFILAICSLIKKTTKKGRAITGLICSGIIVVPVILGLIFMM